MNKSERRKYSKRVELINRRFEVKLFPSIHKAVKSLMSSLAEDMFNGRTGDISNPDLSDAVERLYKRVGVFHANRITRELRSKETKGFGFNEEWVNYILNYFRMHLVENITFGTVESMREYLLPKISLAISEGKSYYEISKELAEDKFSYNQAARIVRTEVNSAANVGTYAAGETYQYETNKEWISAGDARVRGNKPKDHANHVELDGNVVDQLGYFIDSRNGVRLLHPGDPKAIGSRRDKAASVINCRCTHVLIAKRDENDRLIPKRRGVVVIPVFNQNRQTILI